MSHILSLGSRDPTDDADELVVMSQVGIKRKESSPDVSSSSIQNDADFLKFFTPKYITKLSKARYMWASRELETYKDCEIFPAYSVTGFGLLDACLHAHCSNATLVLHPLDILLNICYTFGNHHKKPILHNNEELKSVTQIQLSRQFTRSHILAACIARLARRVETYPLPKLFRLMNAEMNSSDPFVVRLVIGVISYLAGTRDTSRLTVDSMKNFLGLVDSYETLMEAPVSNWLITPNGLLDVRHDPSAQSSCKMRNQAKDAKNQQTGLRNATNQSVTGDPHDSSLLSSGSTTSRETDPSGVQQQARETNSMNSTTKPKVANTDTIGSSGTNDLPANRNCLSRSAGLMLESSQVSMSESCTVPAGRPHADDNDDNAALEWKNNSNNIGYSSSALSEFNLQQRNNANRPDVTRSPDLVQKKPLPSTVYSPTKENGVHAVLFKGSRQAWLELPEMMQELCQFFMVDKRLQTEVLDIGVSIQMSRLNATRESKKFWSNMLFADNSPKTSPDNDIQINGWLSTLLGARNSNEQQGSQGGAMVLNKLCTMKTGIRLPVLLVRLASFESAGDLVAMSAKNTIADDLVLDGSDSDRQQTRLAYYDDYREKLLNNSGNPREVPIGMFLPWRSCEAVNRTRLWRHIGGDSPGVSRTVRETTGSPAARNFNNVGNQPVGRQSLWEDDVSVQRWTVKTQDKVKTKCCSCCFKRAQKNPLEPSYNMCCLMSGICGFCIQQKSNAGGPSSACVRPICFVEIVHED